MKPRISLGMCIVLMLVAAFVAFQITYSALTNKYESTVYSLNKYTDMTANFDVIDGISEDDEWRNTYSIVSEADAYVRESFYGEVDEKELGDFLMLAYMASIDDRYSAYFTSDEYKISVENDNGSSRGVGIRIIPDEATGGLYVYEVMENSPAAASGIAIGDIIVGVEGQSISELGFNEACNKIVAYEDNTDVTLDILVAASDYSKPEKKVVTKTEYEIQNVTVNMISDNVAHVRIHEFNAQTGKEFKKRMDDIISKGAEKFIFDVRSNPGGTVDGVVGVLDYILPEGPIIIKRSKSGEENISYSDAECLNAPMVVLMNSDTASGGELFAAALRDYKVASLIGTTTYGKGSMQTEFPLSNGGCVYFTTHMYFPPNGESYDGIGVVPDKTVELSGENINFMRLSYEEDSQLMAAYDEVIIR